jgi:hypothetical protein
MEGMESPQAAPTLMNPPKGWLRAKKTFCKLPRVTYPEGTGGRLVIYEK